MEYINGLTLEMAIEESKEMAKDFQARIDDLNEQVSLLTELAKHQNTYIATQELRIQALTNKFGGDHGR